ncbi:hypothetical protein LXL04_026156 [Taraxacum kok-saghyz]
MRNPNQMQAVNSHGDDDSSRNDDMVSTNWPPQSYTCTFCKREFRSAQALGGHMNVHRRDRARLCQLQPNLRNSNVTQDHVRNGGLCLLYSLPKPDANFKSSSLDNIKDCSNSEASTSRNCESKERVRIDKKRKKSDMIVEGIDLELRLGCSSLGS